MIAARFCLAFALVSALATAVPVAAQPAGKPIEIAAGKPFRHKHSKLEVPAIIDGIARTAIIGAEPDNLDVTISNETADGSVAIAIHIQRDVGGALPVWFDRARATIESRADIFGTATLSPRPLTFIPPQRTDASGMIATYALAGGKLRATGIAIVPLGGWLVRVRYSSETLDADMVDQRIRAVLATLRWPGRLAPASLAIPVEPCTTPLRVDERSRPAPPDPAGLLFGAILATPDIVAKTRTASPAERWCRDDGVEPKRAVYRAGGQTDGYLIALSDAGSGIRVGRDRAAALMGRDADPSWFVELFQMARNVRFPSQDRLPPPSQATEIVDGGSFVSTASTWGKEKTITINDRQVN